MTLLRYAQNPVLIPKHIKASRPDFEVIGTFNSGVTFYQGEFVLLLRVAERPVGTDTTMVLYPQMTDSGDLVIGRVMSGDSAYDRSDPRLIVNRTMNSTVLTSISHLRLARSHDGYHFEVESRPWLNGEPPYESFGVEDARITPMEGRYYVNFSAVSALGIGTSLVSTQDFENVKRHGLIFPPANRDVVLFPERIHGMYTCYHRPMPSPFGGLNIWMATSPDLIHWGSHRVVLQVQTDGWESGRVGGGAPPLKTERGWLSIYHAASRDQEYCLGAFLTPLDDPGHVIARSKTPILAPQMPYETSGFFQNVVFTCGAVIRDGRLIVYYGAADESIAVAEASVDAVLESLTTVQ